MLNIKIVGSGCASCQKLALLCHEVVTENAIAAEIEKITDINKFAGLGIMLTPGLLLNDQVYSSGKIPTKSTLKNWMMKVSDNQ
ncbi:MAG: thioredoxin family protein [Calditrichaeota bacterium]|nr:MAG: thioredoxin family protein [Calditrichota bacterium]